MRSDAEFYLCEYRKCCEQYVRCPVERRRHRDFYAKLSASMLTAYIEAISPKKGAKNEIFIHYRGNIELHEQGAINGIA